MTTLTFIKFDSVDDCITVEDCNGHVRKLDCHCICAFALRHFPPPPKKLCCRIIVDHKTQLVPPAKRGTAHATKKVVAQIEKVCSEVVVICGVIHKTIQYTAVIDGREVPDHLIKDDVPFQCIIEQDSIKEGDKFRITKQDILCEVFAEEANFGESDHSVAFKFVEKDIIKICIDKVKVK